MTPNWVENKEELNEDTSKWKDSAHDDAGDWFGVKDLIWDLTRDLICSNGMLNRALLVSVKGAEKGQRDWNTKPK